MATVPVPMESSTAHALQGLGRMAPWRQAALLVALAGSIAVGVAGALWLQAPSYVPLEQSFGPADMPAVSEVLERLGVPYSVESGGTVLVDAEQAQEATYALAEAGLSSSPALDVDKFYGEDGGFTATQEDKLRRARRATELDLAVTIARMKPISAAKVHLTIPRRSPFVRNAAKSTAAVMLELRPGHRMTSTQVESVRQLVAQGVEGLQPEAVSVTDQSGRALGRIGELDSERDAKHVEKYEQRMLSKIAAMLTPITGPKGFTAQVTAQFDFSTMEGYTVVYDGESPAVRSRTSVEEVNGGTLGGVPGALTNQPGGEANAPEQADGGEGGAGGEAKGRSRRSETVNSEIDRTSNLISAHAPKLTHLSVAVLLDDRMEFGPDGATEKRPWTPEEISRITTDIRSAMGYSAERQDTVTVSNTRFAPEEKIEPLPEPPLWEQPWVWRLAKQAGIGLLALIMIFGVLKPFMRNLVNREIAEREAEAQIEQARLDAEREQSEEQLALERQQTDEEARALAGPSDFDLNLDAVRNLIEDDPKRAANVMKEWVAGNG